MKIANGIRLILTIMQKMHRDKIRAHAAEAAFFIIMSIFPMLLLMLVMLRYTPITPEQVLGTIEAITPFEITDYLEDTIQSLYHPSETLLPWTILAVLWAAGKGIVGLADGLNAICEQRDERSYLFVRIRAVIYTVILIAAILLSIMLPATPTMIILTVLFAVLYGFLPRYHRNFWEQLPGALFTAITWSVFSFGFSIYLDYAVNMTTIYGSLTTLVVVMLWLYSCMYLLFTGAEINLYIEKPELFTLDR